MNTRQRSILLLLLGGCSASRISSPQTPVAEQAPTSPAPQIEATQPTVPTIREQPAEPTIEQYTERLQSTRAHFVAIEALGWPEAMPGQAVTLLLAQHRTEGPTQRIITWISPRDIEHRTAPLFVPGVESIIASAFFAEVDGRPGNEFVLLSRDSGVAMVYTLAEVPPSIENIQYSQATPCTALDRCVLVPLRVAVDALESSRAPGDSHAPWPIRPLIPSELATVPTNHLLTRLYFSSPALWSRLGTTVRFRSCTWRICGHVPTNSITCRHRSLRISEIRSIWQENQEQHPVRCTEAGDRCTAGSVSLLFSGTGARRRLRELRSEVSEDTCPDSEL